MPKKAPGLTARKVETLKASGLYADGGGLYLQIGGSAAKSWIYRYTSPTLNRRRDMGLGPLAVLSLASARQAAETPRKQVSMGLDPIEAKREAEAARLAEAQREDKRKTFRQAAEALIESKAPGWRSGKHAGQWTATLTRYAFRHFGDVPVEAIDTAAVLKAVAPIWSAKTETASRVRGRIEAVLDFAKVQGWREGDNPARWRGHLALILPEKNSVARVEHHTALPYALVPAFWPRLQMQDGLSARALELQILTAARPGEVLQAQWPEFDLEEALWMIPAGRMKGGLEHRVPLTVPALALLRKVRAVRVNEFVFPGQRKDRPLSDMTMSMVLRRMGVEAVPHGFRSTFRDWAAEQTEFPDAVAEAALAHKVDDRVLAAYRRTTFFERRRKLMAAWADFVEGRTPAARAAE